MRSRIGVDYHVVNSFYQGSRTYLREIYSRLVKRMPHVDFYFFHEKGIGKEDPVLSGMSNVHFIPLPALAAAPIRLYILFPYYQKKYALQAFHSQYILPLPNYAKSFVTIHDLLYELLPQYFSSLFTLRSKLLIRNTAKRATHIFTVSEYTKNDLVTKYHIPSNKITITSNGVDRKRFYPGSDGSEYVEKRGLESGRYILSVGRIDPRKNYETLLASYAMLRCYKYPLVIVGQRGGGYSIEETIARLKLKEKVIIVDNVSDKELPAIYRNARLFVFPSYGEGFGIPLIEAMASGVPIISSNATSIPMTIGDVGMLFNPYSAKSIAEAMRKMLFDEAAAANARRKGLERSNLFNWDSAVDAMYGVYSQYVNEV